MFLTVFRKFRMENTTSLKTYFVFQITSNILVDSYVIQYSAILNLFLLKNLPVVLLKFLLKMPS